jgi:rod shape determining protein RodA
MAMTTSRLKANPELTLTKRLLGLNWTLIALITAVATVGFVMLYSAAKGSFDPWASRQMIRFAILSGMMVVVALIDIRIILRYAYPFYFLVLGLLVAVEVAGDIGMGAQRWIDLGLIRLQPSELMKVALVLALARYFHGLTQEQIGQVSALLFPAILIGMPVALVLRQPDLGTAVMLAIGGVAIAFLAGVRVWVFLVGGAATLSALPIAWNLMHDYQRRRVLTFLNPENDPLGAGYHITQSKIALGSGGIFGKGLMEGTQSYLNFLPEKQTDFIFTMLAEEYGLVGGILLLTLYGLLMLYGLFIALRSRNQFGRLVAMGVTITFSLYVFINIAMVMGLIPVVGVPLPLVSYGGTAMMTVLIGFGLLMNVYIHRDIQIGRTGRPGVD